MSMKKIIALLFVCICLLFTGCNNDYAREEYDSAEKIALEADHYAKVKSIFTSIQGGYSLHVSKFDGRETLWSNVLNENKEIEIDFLFTLSSGEAKVVHIDDEGNVTTIIECSPETSTDEYVTKTVSLKSGRNRLKIVGYDCIDMELEMLSPDL